MLNTQIGTVENRIFGKYLKGVADFNNLCIIRPQEHTNIHEPTGTMGIAIMENRNS